MNENKNNILIKRFASGKVIRTFFYVMGGLVSLLFVFTILFYINRDRIGEKLVLKINDLQRGTVSFSDISFSPFIHFPDMSVKLNNVNYLVHNPWDSVSGIDTIASFEKIYIATDLGSLFSGEVLLSAITVSDGNLSLVEYPDSSLNLSNALKLRGEMPEKTESAEKDSLAETESFVLSLERISISNVNIIYLKPRATDTISLRIEELAASIAFRAGEITGLIDTRVSVRNLSYLNDNWFGPLQVELNSKFSFNEKSGVLNLDPADLKVGSALFDLHGNIALVDPVRIDVFIEASNSEMSFINAWLSENGLQNLQSGESYFSGTVSGLFNGQIPEMIFDFGLKNIDLDIPGVNEHIKDLGLRGSFNSGRASDFSEAYLEIKEIKGQLPGGYLNGTLSVRDFVSPFVSLFWELEADVKGFNEVFNMPGISQLSGGIKFYDRIHGQYDPISKTWLEEEDDESKLFFDSVSVNIDSFGPIRSLSGVISRSHDTLSLQDLSLIAGNSDFRINGNINNLLTLFADDGEEITAELNIVSDTFDLPAFLSFDPRVGESFPYRIVGIDLDVRASSTKDKLLNFESNPNLEFEISHLQATIEKLFPQVVIQAGVMIMAEKEGRVYLTFDDFNLEVANGVIKADLMYYSPFELPDQLEIDADITGLDIALMFFESEDSIPPIAKGNLSTGVQAYLDLGMDSLDFTHLKFDLESLDYFTEKDSIAATGIVIEAQDVQYSAGNNLLASLNAVIGMKARDIRTKYFHLEDISYAIDATKGNFMVYPEKFNLFGKEGEGYYDLRPFEEDPAFAVKYKVEDFPVETLLQKILKDTVLTGLMDVDLEMMLEGMDRDSRFSGLNGYVSLSGHDMTIYGIDLDNLIAKYQKSQKFNLVDLGAVALAGPVGLALTKGSNFATLAIGNFGDATQVAEMISEWDCTNGRLTIKDVAFTTEQNLVAAKGWVDFATDSLHITISVLNKYKCPVVSQSVFGKIENPEQSEVNIVGTVLGPITNLIDGSQGKGCKPFYMGRLKHPLAR